MHVHHCCLVVALIVQGLEKSTPPAPRSVPTVAKIAVFASGKIPRGRVKTSPKSTPPPSGTREELLTLIDETAKHLAHAAGLGAGTWIKHPVLGALRRDDALKFIRIHNRHHLRIVADILRAARS